MARKTKIIQTRSGEFLWKTNLKQVIILVCLTLFSTGCGSSFPEKIDPGYAIWYSMTGEDSEGTPYSDSSESTSSAKEITSFGFSVFDNFALAGDVTANISGTSIEIKLPAGELGVNTTELVPRITFTGVAISPSGGEIQDFSFPVTYRVTAENGDTQEYTVRAILACPENYVPVPANVDMDVMADFCVAKYEMRDDGAGNAVSQAENTPWNEIGRDSAITACQAIGDGFDLMSNAQWQTVARNVEKVASNWSDGILGSGYLNYGHSDESPGVYCDSLYEYVDGSCDNSGNALDFVQKRTHNLSSGEIIWDLAGNIGEWVSDTNADDHGRADAPAVTTIMDQDVLHRFGPEGDHSGLDTAPFGGFGFIWFGDDGGIYRGGDWNDYLYMRNAGVFATSLEGDGDEELTRIGFRCVYNQ